MLVTSRPRTISMKAMPRLSVLTSYDSADPSADPVVVVRWRKDSVHAPDTEW
jgi:hypothetical protein